MPNFVLNSMCCETRGRHLTSPIDFGVAQLEQAGHVLFQGTLLVWFKGHQQKHMFFQFDTDTNVQCM